jgi:hypothetical protein
LAFHSRREVDHSPPSGAGVGEWVELCLHSPNAPSWRGARLGGAQGRLYLFTLPTFQSQCCLDAKLLYLTAPPNGVITQKTVS